ncbi:cytochrome-b5 reductase like protein [Gorgonomyces haynaldii]|nr:cytochrome-b5 reductase like protein [Gorgonomyces haynaldii]
MFLRIAKRLQSTASSKSNSGLAWLAVATAGAAGAWYLTQGKPTPVPSLNGEFQQYKLDKIIDINHNTKTFRFKLPEGTTELGLPTASCVVTRFQNGTKADGSPKYVIRPYTPIEDPAKPNTGFFDLIVKVYPQGVMSSHIHSLKVGDTLEMKGPVKKFQYEPNKLNHVGLIAGGTGITPMIQIMQRILSNPEDKTKISLLFSNLSEDDIICKDLIDDMQKKHPEQVKVYYFVDKPSKDWKQGVGFINQKSLEEYMPKPGQGQIFVCGPPPMLEAYAGKKAPDYSQGELNGLLKKMGYSIDNVYKL